MCQKFTKIEPKFNISTSSQQSQIVAKNPIYCIQTNSSLTSDFAIIYVWACANAVREVKRRCRSILSAPSRSNSLARLLCPLELKIGRGLQALSRPAAGENLVIVTQPHTLSPPQHVVPLMKGTPTWLERWALYSCGRSISEVNLVSLDLKWLEKFIKCIVTLTRLKFRSFTLPLDLPDSGAVARFSWMEWIPPRRSRCWTVLQAADVALTKC